MTVKIKLTLDHEAQGVRLGICPFCDVKPVQHTYTLAQLVEHLTEWHLIPEREIWIVDEELRPLDV